MLRGVGIAGAAAITGTIRVTDLAALAPPKPEIPAGVSSSATYLYSSVKVNPFKDPAYAEGARQRLAQLGNADPEGANAIFLRA